MVQVLDLGRDDPDGESRPQVPQHDLHGHRPPTHQTPRALQGQL